jgi:hypothetical protein
VDVVAGLSMQHGGSPMTDGPTRAPPPALPVGVIDR